MICKLNNTDISNWKQFIEYDESIYIKYIIELKEFILLGYKENGNNLVRVIPYVNSKYMFNDSWKIEVEDSIKKSFIPKEDEYIY